MRTDEEEKKVYGQELLQKALRYMEMKSFAGGERPTINAVDKKKHGAKRGEARTDMVTDCWWCQRNHPRGKCPAYGKDCNDCGERNHFAGARKCNGLTQQANFVAESSQREHEKYFEFNSVQMVDDAVSKLEKRCVEVTICGQSVKLQIDTGADLNVLSSATWEKLGRPNIDVARYACNDFMQRGFDVVGETNLVVRLPEPKRVRFTIVKSTKQYGLLGMETLAANPKLLEELLKECRQSALGNPLEKQNEFACNAITAVSKDVLPEAEPWERLHVDWGRVPGVGDILVVVDAGSGWVEAARVPDRSTESVITMLRRMFSMFGVPKNLVTDHGDGIVSEKLTEWLRRSGCTLVEVQRENGLAERAVQMVKKQLASWYPGARVTFDTHLDRIVLGHRCARQARGKTPAEILLKFPVRVPSVSDFETGEVVLYKPQREKSEIKAEFLHGKSENALFIMVDGRMCMARGSQVGKAGVGPEPETANPNGNVDVLGSMD